MEGYCEQNVKKKTERRRERRKEWKRRKWIRHLYLELVIWLISGKLY